MKRTILRTPDAFVSERPLTELTIPSCSDTPTPHPLQSELEGRTLRQEENIRRVMRAIEKERGSIDPTEPPSYERWRYTLVAMGSIKIISSCLLLDKLIKLFKFCYHF